MSQESNVRNNNNSNKGNTDPDSTNYVQENTTPYTPFPEDENDCINMSQNKDQVQEVVVPHYNCSYYNFRQNEVELRNKLHSFIKLSTPYFRHNKRGQWLLFTMVVLTLLVSAMSVVFSYIGRDFWSALSNKDVSLFWKIVCIYAIALSIGVPLSVLYTYQKNKLAVAWREWMTSEYILKLYFQNQMYYQLEQQQRYFSSCAAKEDENNLLQHIDNPDQRICQDIVNFTSYSLSFFIIVLRSTIDLVSFSIILFSIKPDLFMTIIAYATFGTVMSIIIGRKLATLNFLMLKKKANFRYILIRIRDYSESIAFYKGISIEESLVKVRFAKVIENALKIVVAKRNLEYFTTSYDYLIQILPIAVIAPMYFRGEIELGVISQTVGAFNHILNDLSLIVNQFEGLAGFAAAIDRLDSFVSFMEQNNNQDLDCTTIIEFGGERLSKVQDEIVAKRGKIQLMTSQQNSPLLLSIQELNLYTPDYKRQLIHNLSIQLTPHSKLLITGNSGTGKSSLLRAIAGLWNSGSGKIQVNSKIKFLPQKPYCSLGNLLDQLLYPHSSLDFPVKLEKVNQLLHTLNLQHLLEENQQDSYYEEKDWSAILSLGEQQRMSFARLLLLQEFNDSVAQSQPQNQLIILDEATSALDVTMESKLYQSLRDFSYISVGHRPSLFQFHNLNLHIHDDHSITIKHI